MEALLLLHLLAPVTSQKIAGILRQFNGHPDFGTKAAGYSVTVSGYNSATQKPIYSASNQNPIPQFTDWFSDVSPYVSGLIGRTPYIVSMTGPSPTNLYTFQSSNFAPVNPATFSLELRANLTSPGPLTLSFTSGGLLYFFINDALVFQISQTSSSPAAQQYSFTVPQGLYFNMSLFYARVGQESGSFSFQLPIVAPGCNALTARSLIEGLGPMVANSNIFLSGLATLVTSSTLRLVSINSPYSFSSAWYPTQIRINSGFSVRFNLAVTGTRTAVEGFAFVIQNLGNRQTGSAAYNLGYNFANSVAVEFDMQQNGPTGTDKDGNHVEVHTNYGSINSPANTQTATANQVPVTAAAPFSWVAGYLAPIVNLSDSTVKEFQIDYIPNSGQGRINVYLVRSNFLSLLNGVNVDSTLIGQALGNFVYMGFTSATTDVNNQANIDISNWRIWTTPTSGPHSSTTTQLSSIAASNVPSSPTYTVAAFDACGVRVQQGGAQVVATAVLQGTSTAVPVGVQNVDSGTGTYQLSLYYTVATALSVTVSLNNVPISGSPFALTVTPNVVNAPTCNYTWTDLCCGTKFGVGTANGFPSSVSWPVTSLHQFTIYSNDAYGNLQPNVPGLFTLYVAGETPITAAVTSTPGIYQATLSTNNSYIGTSFYVRYTGIDIQNSPQNQLTISPGLISGTMSLVEGSLSPLVAGMSAAGRAVPRDQFGNTLQDITNPLVPAPTAGPTGAPTSPYIVSGTLTTSSLSGSLSTFTWAPAGTFRAHWGFTASATIAGTYTLQIQTRAGGAATPVSWPAYQIVIVPASTAANRSVIDPDGYLANPLAIFQPTFFYIQTYDAYGNLRSAPIGASETLVTTISYQSSSQPLDCVSGNVQNWYSTPSQPILLQAQCSYFSLGRYKVQFTPYTVGSFSVLGTFVGSTVGGAAKSFNVAPGRPDPDHSSVVCPATGTAGQTVTCTVTLKDAYDNVATALVSELPVVLSYQGSLTTAPVAPNALTAVATGSFSYTWKGFQSGSYRLVVSYLSSPLGVTSKVQTITVSPSTVWGPSCTPSATGLSAQYRENTTQTLTFQPFDEYGNYIPYDVRPPSTLTCSLTTQVTSYPVTCSYITTATPYYYAAVFNVPLIADVSGTVLITVTTAGNTSTVITQPFTIVSGTQSYAWTIPLTGQISATSDVLATFQIYDAKSNFQPKTFPAVAPDSNTSFVIQIQALDKSATIGSVLSLPAVGNNVYSVAFTPVKATTYSLAVLVNGFSINNNATALPTIVVVAGAPNALTSSISCPSSTIVNVGVECIITLRDRNNNLITTTTPVPTPNLVPSSTFSATFTTPTVNPDGTWTTTFTSTLAKAHKISVSLNGAQIYTALPVTITVAPGPPAAPSRLVFSFGQDAIAGRPRTFCVQLNDAYNNPCNLAAEDLSQNFTYSLELNPPNMALTAAPQGFGCTQTPYGAQLVVQTVRETDVPSQNGLLLTVVLDYHGQLLTISLDNNNQNAVINAEPGDLDPTQSSFIPPDPSAVIVPGGGTFVFQYQARDAYGNKLRRGAVDDLSFSPTGPGPIYGQPNINNGPLGLYDVDLTPIVIAGRYTLVPSWKPTSTALPPVYATALPGAAVAANTIFDAVAPSYVAGDANSLLFTLRDYYYNVISNYSNDQVQVFILDGGIGPTTCYSPNPLIPSTPNLTLDVTSLYFFSSNANVTTQLANGRISAAITTHRAATYTLYAKINNEWAYSDAGGSGCPKVSQILKVIPAALDPPTSELQGPALLGAIAGTESYFLVVLKDRFGNTLLGSQVTNDRVAVNVSSVLSGPAPSCDTQYEFLLVTTPADDLGDGTFKVKILFTTAKTFYVAASVNNYLVGLPADCPTLTVNPTYVFNYTKENELPVIVAARPDLYDVYSFDFYTNLVNPGYGLQSYTAQISRSNDPMAADVLDYTFAIPAAAVGDHHNVLYVPEWAGVYTAHLDLKQPGPANRVLAVDIARTFTYTVLPATCAEESGNATTRYRCLDRSCVANACDCTTQACCGAQKCWDGSCAATCSSCPSGMVQCPGWGHCVNDSSQCPTASVDCGSLVRCPGTQLCVASLADCASKVKCQPGYTRCPDSSCVRDSTTCPKPLTCQAGKYLCPTGQCVIGAENCPTITSCASGLVLCPDGSCKTSEQLCASTYDCYDPVPYRCADGSCRSAQSDCPTPVTCPLGFVKCENGQCASSAQACLAATSCPPHQVRCPDASCRNNTALCPTGRTCPVGTVMCPDFSCKADVQQCGSVLTTCSSAKPFKCPDGSCSSNIASCPTDVVCPFTSPVRCADGSCVASAALCRMAHSCLKTQVHCPDGSCRSTFLDCPTPFSCPATSPVRCPDGSCSAGSLTCPPLRLLDCPSNYLRCPGGECAASYSSCPSRITCSGSFVRCTDGSCRSDCGKVSSRLCPPGSVTCPGIQGVVCAARLSDCPTDIVCPIDKPRRCQDRSCAYTVAECPTALSNFDNKYACPEGTWANDPSFCGQPVVCPEPTPIKCWDRTCRVAPQDCPPAPSCSQSNPYLCYSGVCVSDPNLCSTSSVCPAQQGWTFAVKCALASDIGVYCAQSSASCRTIYNFSQSAAESFSTYYQCPDNGIRCRDGSCQVDQSGCRATVCPHYLPQLCQDGSCARKAAECPRADGCPSDQQRCWNGQCAATCPTAPKTQACNVTGLSGVNCPDGSCAATAAACPQANGCGNGTVLCSSRECVSKSTLLGLSVCSAGASTYNVCPFHRPYRCADGYCAMSSTLCPVVGTESSCPSNRPVKCADESCVLSADQCPTLVPCPTGTVRCPSGHCRASQNLCQDRWLSPCPAGRPNLCPDGRCVADKCIDPVTGCPQNTTKCPSGLCVSNPAACPQFACPSGQQQCADGSCSSSCPARNVCGAKPYVCGGQCTSTPASGCVLASNSCPLNTPIRCADGTCAKYAAWPGVPESCPPTVVCTGLEPYRCSDGSCVGNPKYCRPVHPCSNPAHTLCANRTCAASCSATCPPTLSTLCPNGACRRSYRECEVLVQSCPAGRYLCWDGTCQTTPFECIRLQSVVQNKALADSNQAVDAICSGVICSDGSCVANATMCTPTPGCPAVAPVRCWDGSCVNQTCPAVTANKCPVSTTRCPDGACRKTCLPYNGCGLQFPKFCPGQSQMCIAATATCAAQDSCADGCERDIPSIVQAVTVKAGTETVVDVSLDSNYVPRTRLRIPSGAFGGDRTLSILPVGMDTLFTPSFASKVISSPFRCAVDGVSSFALNITVEGAVTTKVYAAPTAAQLARRSDVPCELQGPYVIAAKITVNGVSSICQGVMNFTARGFAVSGTGQCAALANSGTLVSVDNANTTTQWNTTVYAWDQKTSRHCICFKQKSGTLVCWSIIRNSDSVLIYEASAAAKKGMCAPMVADANTDVKTLTRQALAADVCATTDYGTSIPPFDICLAVFSGSQWNCLEAYNERVTSPPWNGSSTAQPSFRVTGRLPKCDPKVAYAFLNIPLPPPPQPYIATLTWWQQYGTTTIVLIVVFGLFFIGAAYGIWRLCRYRRKYKEEKKELDNLHDRAAELDEFHSGLGVGDEEIAMIANPLVIQMQELEVQMKKVEEDMNLQEEKDAHKIDELEQQRQRLFAEIQRVKDEMAKVQAAQKAQRVAEGPPAETVAAAQSTVTTTGQGEPAVAAQSTKPAVRQDFGQVKRPGKKQQL